MKIRVPRKRRDSYQHGSLREALIQAGLKMLAEGGIDTLSLRGAAQLAGVSHAAPYRHFRDKEDLVAAVAERGFKLLDASMRDERDRCTSPDARERLVALGVGYVDFALRQPASLHMMFSGALAKANVPPELTAAGNAAYATLRDTVASGIARGELRPDDPDRLSLACWSLVHGLSMLLINGAIAAPPTPSDERGMVAALVRLLGQGVYLPTTPPAPSR